MHQRTGLRRDGRTNRGRAVNGWSGPFVRGFVLWALMVVAGFLVGRAFHHPVRGLVLGSAVAVFAIVLREAMQAGALARWLASDPDGKAPRGSGWWSELAYRVETALRARRRDAQAERERMARFLEAIEASPNGVLLMDDEHAIVWCNAAAADQFGIDPRGDLGQPITNLVRAPAFVQFVQGDAGTEPLIFNNSRGPEALAVWVRSYGGGMRLMISQDVSERTRNEAMRRDFVANVSHEIRTPLTVLSGFLETLENLPLTEVERQRVVSLMRQQADRMQVLVSDLLTLARLEGSPRPAADSWVSLSGLFKRALADAQALSGGKHRFQAVVPLPDAEHTELAGAEAELFSALGNLLSNAVRYTPEGGDIEVGWQLLADGSGQFHVRDSGIGISPEHVPRLTQRFYRVDGSRSRDTGGTGLGLSIVKHVIERHGGELLIDSSPGKGSTFTLRLPPSRVRIRPKPVDMAQQAA